MKKGLLLVLALLINIAGYAYDLSVKNSDGVLIYYNYINNNTELEVTYEHENSSYIYDIIIPDEVPIEGKTYHVTRIGNRAFKDDALLTSISLPQSLKEIGYAAFRNCSKLKSLTIPSKVIIIEDEAFTYCNSLTSVKIPDSVTNIGGNAFSWCEELKSVSISNSVTNIGAYAFEGCSNLTTINIPNNLETISYCMFSQCKSLRSVVIPNSVRLIEERAFINCAGLTTLTIPNSVTGIGDNAFDYCDNLDSIYSYIENPFAIEPSLSKSRTFSSEAYSYAILFVPEGTIEKYKNTRGWNSFARIKSLSSIPSSLISVIEEDTVCISSNSGNINIRGKKEGQHVAIYTASGELLGSTKISKGQANIHSNLKSNNIAIVKVGNKTVKIVMQ